MYFLRKIHKRIIPPPGRQIVSANGCLTEKNSKFVGHFFNTPSTLNKSYVKDITHFLKSIRDAGVVPPTWSHLMQRHCIHMYQHSYKFGNPSCQWSLGKTQTKRWYQAIQCLNNKVIGMHSQQENGPILKRMCHRDKSTPKCCKYIHGQCWGLSWLHLLPTTVHESKYLDDIFLMW